MYTDVTAEWHPGAVPKTFELASLSSQLRRPETALPNVATGLWQHVVVDDPGLWR